MNRTFPDRWPAWIAWVLTAACLSSACGPGEDRPARGSEAGDPTPRAAVESSRGATCAAHGAPEELCFICDASLRDKGRLWCAEHGRYEDRCWECHPELEDPNRLWCKEHALYEDECFLCHPELLDRGTALMCNEHGVPEAECGICHPELLADRPGLKVRLPSTASAAKAGVVVGTPNVQPMDDGVDCLAEFEFDRNRLARITSLARGVVRSVEVDLGSRVERGDLLATLTSAAIGEAQNAYLRALAEVELRERELDRQRRLLDERIASEQDHQVAEAGHRIAEAAVRQARQGLSALGFDELQIEALAEQRSTPGVLELRAPFAGEIVERSAVQGSVVETADVLFTITDPSVLWAMVDIPESQLSRVTPGQTVELTVESLPGRTFPGTLTWVSPQVNDRTRMALGRVEVPNVRGELKAQMFARARIATTRSEQAVVVPVSAIQNVTGTQVVFVKAAEDLFEARPVRLGARRGESVEIADGLRPGEIVVVAGGFALKSQFLISRLGAGCVDE